jgi:hypothetical protein
LRLLSIQQLATQTFSTDDTHKQQMEMDIVANVHTRHRPRATLTLRIIIRHSIWNAVGGPAARTTPRRRSLSSMFSFPVGSDGRPPYGIVG